MNRPVRRALTAAVASLALLAGCSDNPEPAPLDADSSPSASPSADAAPEMPDEAKENTPEGAEAFVRHYFEALSVAFSTGETDQVSTLARRECSGCTAITSEIESIYKDGGRVEGGRWAAQRVQVADVGGSSDVPVTVLISLGRSTVTHKKGAEATTSKPTERAAAMSLRYEHRSWRVVSFLPRGAR
ncbi:MAG: DUF6318 family protein [Nocardioides sp.]|nr:DUF6318 family protein [Nocardioides sp.]